MSTNLKAFIWDMTGVALLGYHDVMLNAYALLRQRLRREGRLSELDAVQLVVHTGRPRPPPFPTSLQPTKRPKNRAERRAHLR